MAVLRRGVQAMRLWPLFARWARPISPRNDVKGHLNPSMSDSESPSFEGGYERLLQAERSGLRLAIVCRTVAVGLAFGWVLFAWIFLNSEPGPWVFLTLGAFTLIGVLHAAVIGTRFDRRWMKYSIYAIDLFGICAAFAFVPISFGSDIPQILAFRAYGIYYLFPVVAMSALSLSPGLVLWAGGVAVLGWWAAFLFVVSGMERTLSWSDIPPGASREIYDSVFLSMEFIGRGNRIEESGFLLISAGILALAVWRARRVFLSQVQAQAERERIARTLGRYVPEAIAKRLIADPSALHPSERHAAVLVMDISGFTTYSEGRSPTEVIVKLNRFLSRSADAITQNGGVVIHFTGDGLMAAFGTPIELPSPEANAIAAGRALLEQTGGSDFDLRIGLSAGPVASGSVGSIDRQEFKVYGETVNRAFRLEAHCKIVGRPMLLDAQIARAAGGLALEEFEDVHMRGLTKGQTIYAADPPAEKTPGSSE